MQAAAAAVDLVSPPGAGDEIRAIHAALAAGMLAVGSWTGGARDSVLQLRHVGERDGGRSGHGRPLPEPSEPNGLGQVERHELRHGAGERGDRRWPGHQ